MRQPRKLNGTWTMLLNVLHVQWKTVSRSSSNVSDVPNTASHNAASRVHIHNVPFRTELLIESKSSVNSRLSSMIREIRKLCGSHQNVDNVGKKLGDEGNDEEVLSKMTHKQCAHDDVR